MEPIAMANLTSELAYWFSLSIYPIIMANITRGRRSEIRVKDNNRSLQDKPTHIHTYLLVKDTDSEHINPINSVLVVVPVYSVVTAQQSSGLIALRLRVK